MTDEHDVKVTRRHIHLTLSITLALLATTGTVLLDRQRSDVHQSRTGLAWARQIATQAWGMTLKAKEAGTLDPLNWAVSYLAQGEEPRLIKITKMPLDDDALQVPESFLLDNVNGLFEYTKVFAPEESAGIRIQLNIGYTGYLGTKSGFANDLLVSLTLFIYFVASVLATGRYFGFGGSARLRNEVSECVGRAKTQLAHLGGNIREMVRQAQRLAQHAMRTQKFVGDLRENIHTGLTRIHDSGKLFDGADQISSRAESVALSAMIEANRIGGEASRIAAMAEELHRAILKLRDINHQGKTLILDIEKQIEPWSTDADVAFHSYDEVRETAQVLSAQITKTTASLVGQAKLIQALHVEVDGPDAAPTNTKNVKTAAPASAPANAPEAAEFPAALPPLDGDENLVGNESAESSEEPFGEIPTASDTQQSPPKPPRRKRANKKIA